MGINMIIYKVTNLVNGKIYIGQSTKDDPNYFGSGRLIKKSIKKNGIENFKRETLVYCKYRNNLNEMERFYISHFNCKYPNGYNLTDGGEGCVGVEFSEERRKEISMRFSGKKRPKHSEFMKGSKNPSRREDVKLKRSKSIQEWWNKRRPKPESILCLCGCGQLTKPGNRYITKHISKVFNPNPKGSKRTEISGNNSPTKRPDVREKMSVRRRGIPSKLKGFRYEDILGKEKAHNLKIARSESAKKMWEKRRNESNIS